MEREGLPVVKSSCPADGHTQRQVMKEFLARQERESSGFQYRVFGALRRSGLDGWGFPAEEGRGGKMKERTDTAQDS